MALNHDPLDYSKLFRPHPPARSHWQAADALDLVLESAASTQPYRGKRFKTCNINTIACCAIRKCASTWLDQGMQQASWRYTQEIYDCFQPEVLDTLRYPDLLPYRAHNGLPSLVGRPYPRNFTRPRIVFGLVNWHIDSWQLLFDMEEAAFGHCRVTRFYYDLARGYARSYMRHYYCIPTGCGGRWPRPHVTSTYPGEIYYSSVPIPWTPIAHPGDWNRIYYDMDKPCCYQWPHKYPKTPGNYRHKPTRISVPKIADTSGRMVIRCHGDAEFIFKWHHWPSGGGINMRYISISNVYNSQENFIRYCRHVYVNGLDGPAYISFHAYLLNMRYAISELSTKGDLDHCLTGPLLTTEMEQAARDYISATRYFDMPEDYMDILIAKFHSADIAALAGFFTQIETAFFTLVKLWCSAKIDRHDSCSQGTFIWNAARAAFRLYRAIAAAMPQLLVYHALPLLGHVITARILDFLHYTRTTHYLGVKALPVHPYDVPYNSIQFFRHTNRPRITLQADLAPARPKKESKPTPAVAPVVTAPETLSRRAQKRIAREERKKEKLVSESKRPDHVAARTVIKALGLNRGNAPKLDNSDIKRVFRHIKEHKDRGKAIDLATKRMQKIMLQGLFDTKAASEISVSFQDLSKNISEAIAQIAASTTTASLDFSTVGRKVEGLTERLESLVTMASEAMKSAASTIQFTGRKILTAQNIVEFGIAFKAYYDYASEASLFLACSAISRILFDQPLDSVFALALNLFRRIFSKKEEKIKLQGYLPFANLFNFVPSTEAIKSFGTFAGKVNTIIALFKHFKSFLQWITDQLFSTISPDLLQNTVIKRDVEKWISKVMNRFADGGATKAAREHVYAEQIQSLTLEGGALLSRLAQLGDWPAARALQTALQNALGFCKTMLLSANPILDSTAKRPCPVTLWFHGPGGVGKSTLTQFLMDASVAQYPTRRPYRRGNDIYHYNPSQEFWNGFHGQQVFFASEAFQIVDSQVRLKAFETWFKTGEDCAWTVNMAQMEHKGTMYCEPELCVWAENATLEETGLAKYITDPGAAMRRMALEVKVLPTKEAIDAGYFLPLPKGAYRYSGPDYNFHPEYLEFHIKRVESADNVLKEVWDWERLVAFVTEQRKKNRESYYAKLKQLSEPLNDKSAFVRANAQIVAMTDEELAATCPADRTLNQHRTDLLVQLMNKEYEKSDEEFPVKEFWRMITQATDTPSEWMKLRTVLATTLHPAKAAVKQLANWKDCFFYMVQKHPKRFALQIGGTVLAIALGTYTAWKWFEEEVPISEFIRVWHEDGGYTDVNRHDLSDFTCFLESNQDHRGYMRRWHGRKDVAKERDHIDHEYQMMHWMKDLGEGRGLNLQADDRYSAIERCVCHLVTHPRISKIHCIRIAGCFMLTNKHYMMSVRKMIKEYPDFRITINGMPNAIKDCYMHPTKDVAMFLLDRNVPSVSEAQRHFASSHESELRPGDAIYRTMTNERTRVTGRLDSESDFDGITVPLGDIVEYSAIGKAGMCGIPVCWAEPSRQEKIVGIHSGALGNLSYFTRVTKEEVEKLLAAFDGPPIPPPALQGKMPILNGMEDFRFVRLARPDEVCDMPTKSSIIPSYLHGLFPQTSSPAHLSSRSESLLGKALRKADVPTPRFSKREINGASTYLQVNWPSPKRPPYPVPLHQAWEGVEGDPYRKSLRGATSPGFPFICRGNNLFKKKADMVSEGQIHPVVVEMVRSFREQAARGETPEVIFVPMLKDERRPLEKVDNPRMIDNPPIHYILVNRSLFMNPLADFYESHNIWESAVAVSPMSIEWMWMYKKLTKFGLDGFIAGDFSAFDKTLNPDIIARAVELLARRLILQDHEIKIVEAIIRTTSPHLLLVDRDVIEVPHGNPSGNPLTVYINTVAVLILVRIAYLNLNPDQELASFEANVVVKAYGDDNVTGTAPKIRSWFNQRTLTQFFASRGMKYTTPAKDGSDPESFHITEVTFLKRYFREEDGWIYGPLELHVLKEEIMWMRKQSSSKSEFSQQVMTMLQELSLWDEATFNEVSDQVRIACLEADVPFPPVERAAFMERVRNNHVDGLEPNEVYYPGISTTENPLDDPATHLVPIALQGQLLGQWNPPRCDSAFGEGKICTSKQLQSNFKSFSPRSTPAPASSTGFIVDANFSADSLAAPLNSILDALTNSQSPLLKSLYIIESEQISMRKRLDSLICAISSVATTELDDPAAVRNNSWIRLIEGYQKHMDKVQTIIAKQNMPASAQSSDPTSWTETDLHLASPLLNVVAQTGKLAPSLSDAADHGVWDLARRNLVMQSTNVDVSLLTDSDTDLRKWASGNWLVRANTLADHLTIGTIDNVPSYSIPLAVVNSMTVEPVHHADDARSLSSFVHPNRAGARIGVMEAIAATNAAIIVTGTNGQYNDADYMSTAFTWDKGTSTYAVNATTHPGRYALVTAVDSAPHSKIELQMDIEDADPLEPVETDDVDAVAQVIDDPLAESVAPNVPTGDSDGTANTVHQITVMDDTEFNDERGIVRPWRTHNAVSQDEKSWAERAKPFTTFNWDTTWVAGKILYFNPFSSRFLDPAVICKLRGRTYFNANLKIRVMVNGMKFHAGRMVVTWIARNRMGDFHESREPTLTYCSQLPIQAEVHADAPCTVEINIPFLQQEAELYFNTVAPVNAYIQTNEQNCIGLVAIYAQTDFYSMCTTNGYATVSAWAMIEGLSLSDVYRDDEIDLANIDVPPNLANRIQLPPSYQVANQPTWKWTSDVLAPQTLPVVPAPPRIELQGFFQSIIGAVGTVGKIAGGIAGALGGGGGGGGSSAPAAPAPKAPARGGRGRVPVKSPEAVGAATKAEAAKKGPGPVQSIAGKVASVAKPLALIPDIGAAAAGVGTVASAISSIASIFHLDKPRDQTGVTKVLQQWKDFTHADGLEMAPTLGLQTGNEVFGHGQSQPASSTRIADLVSIPAIIDLQVIQPTALSGTHIASFMVHPAEVPCYAKEAKHVDTDVAVPGALGVRAPTCSSVIADAFLQWRGEFEYHFSFVCNQFTQMTVLCLWDPTFPEEDVLTRPAYENATNYISKIFQIQGNSEFVFTVPFANRTWSMNSQFDDMRTDAYTGRKLNPRSFNGVLHLYVVNAIVNFQCEGNQPVSMVTARRMSSASFYRPTLDAASTLRIYEGMTYFVNVLEETQARKEELKRRAVRRSGKKIELQGGLNIGTFFGETVSDIMGLCKRETPIAVIRGPRIKMFSFFTDVFPVWPGARVSSLEEGAHSSFTGNIALNSSKNYLSYFRQLFLTWRGPVTATLVNYTTVDGESTSECNSSFMANYALNYNGAAAAFHELALIAQPNNEIVSEPVIQDWRRYAADGMVYRPVNVPQMPMTAVMPYYSNQNFLFTPAELSQSYGTCDIGLIPALALQVQQGADDVSTLMIGAGDTFTFGGFWPPSTTVHTPLNVDVSQIDFFTPKK